MQWPILAFIVLATSCATGMAADQPAEPKRGDWETEVLKADAETIKKLKAIEAILEKGKAPEPKLRIGPKGEPETLKQAVQYVTSHIGFAGTARPSASVEYNGTFYIIGGRTPRLPNGEHGPLEIDWSHGVAIKKGEKPMYLYRWSSDQLPQLKGFMSSAKVLRADKNIIEKLTVADAKMKPARPTDKNRKGPETLQEAAEYLNHHVAMACPPGACVEHDGVFYFSGGRSTSLVTDFSSGFAIVKGKPALYTWEKNNEARIKRDENWKKRDEGKAKDQPSVNK